MKKTLIFALAATFVIACKKDTPPTPQPTNKYGSGVLICNEGVFQTGVGTVSFYDREAKSIQNDVYQNENNGVPLGNILQSATQIGNKLYFVVNNSQQIVVANAGSMAHLSTISGLQSPRYLHAVSSDKAYISDWSSNSLAILNLKTNTISGSISTGNGPENMLQVGSRLFVSNSGGFSLDSTLTVINTITDDVEATYVVGPNPASLQIDVNGSIWVLCAGVSDWQNPANDKAGRLVQIDRTTGTIAQSFLFPNKSDHPAKLAINSSGTELYYLSSGYGGDVYKMNISNPALPTSPFISGTFYALGVDPANNEIYVSDPLDYNQRGTVYRYNTNAQIVDSVKAGIIPGNFLFR